MPDQMSSCNFWNRLSESGIVLVHNLIGNAVKLSVTDDELFGL